MNIGIIGAGNIGSALAYRLVELGHDVVISNSRGPETLGEVVADTGATAVSAWDAARGRDLVVITIPECRVPDLPRDLFEGVPEDVVVIDTNNYYPRERDGRIDAIEQGTTETRWVAQQVGRPGTVKAFNNIQAARLRHGGHPAGDPQRIALPYAGDDADAKAAAAALIDALGFDPVDAGSLDDSWRQQPGTPCYGADLGANDLRAALAAAPRERPSDFSAED
ncbi:MAG TPA: NAD(P)-binding domain-containing protein [Solirubrobacteraceae bacterium]|nr:NAD(P)-binding domain-containing protein [Solirubrobacteraceae bacterium]